MKISIGKPIGNAYYTFEVEETDQAQAIEEAIRLDRLLPEKCEWCQSKNLKLVAEKGERKSDQKTFTFIKLRCNDCFGFKKMGIRQDDKKIFFHDWEKYDKESGQTIQIDRSNYSKSTKEKSEDETEIPF